MRAPPAVAVRAHLKALPHLVEHFFAVAGHALGPFRCLLLEHHLALDVVLLVELSSRIIHLRANCKLARSLPIFDALPLHIDPLGATVRIHVYLAGFFGSSFFFVGEFQHLPFII